MSSVDTSLFKTDLVFFDFEARDRFELFEKLGAVLKEKGYIADTWLEAIEARERDYPTGLAFENISVAIPHVDPEHLIKPYIAIVKPKEPVVPGCSVTLARPTVVVSEGEGVTEAP